MTNANDQNHMHPETTPAEVRDIAGALDALAARDRSAAPAGFEDRLLLAARGGASTLAPVAGRVGAARRNPWAGLRLAATLGVVGSVGLLAAVYVIGTRHATSPVGGPIAVAPNAPFENESATTGDPLDVESIEAEFEEYLAALDGSDSQTDPLGTSGDGFWDVGNALTQEGSL